MTVTICFYCRHETDAMLDGKVCCEACSEPTMCAACMCEFPNHSIEWFGPDAICQSCLPEIVEELYSDDDPDWVPDNDN